MIFKAPEVNHYFMATGSCDRRSETSLDMTDRYQLLSIKYICEKDMATDKYRTPVQFHTTCFTQGNLLVS